MMNMRIVLASIGMLAVGAAGYLYLTLAPGRAGSGASQREPLATVSAVSVPSGAASAAGGAPVSVTSVPAQMRDVDIELEATGTVTSANSVDVRPQVNSVITKVHIREGQFVKTGELLFSLDTRADDTNVAKAQAQLAKDQATLADAQRQLARSQDLFAQKFVAKAAIDTNLSLVESQAAVVAADKVAIDAARVGLSYGRIVAPSSGRAGAINVYIGSSVQANTTTLVTITQLDPIYVGFNLPQRNVGDALQSLLAGGGKVSAVLPESKGALNGRLQFVDNTVDPASGTVKVKAIFANKGQALWPGAFVNVRMAVRTIKDAVVVPLAAVVQGARARVVFVIDAGGKATVRPVELVLALGTEAVVSGVRPGERVIVDGRQNVRPGTSVVDRAPAASRPAGVASVAAGAASTAAVVSVGGQP